MRYPLLALLLFTCYIPAGAQHATQYLAEVQLNGKYGYIDTLGKEVIPPIYDAVGTDSNDDAKSWGNNLIPVNIGKSNPEGEGPPGITVRTSEGQPQKEQRESAAVVRTEGKWGYCNASGKLVIPAQFTDVSQFSEGRAGVAINGKWGYLDTTGIMVIPALYEKVKPFTQGLAVVAKNGRYGFINTKGEEVIIPQYAYAASFQNGYARVSEKHVSKDDRKQTITRIINPKGEMITAAAYDIESDFSDGLAIFSLADGTAGAALKYGIINTKGEVIVLPIYDEIADFSDGLARVMLYKPEKGTQWGAPAYGYINRQGKEIITPSLATADNFRYGMAVVSEIDDSDDGWSKHALINNKGKTLLGFNWKSLDLIDSNVLVARPVNKDQSIVMNTKGETIVAADYIKYLGNGLFMVTNENEEPITFIATNKKISIDLNQNKSRKFLSYQYGLIRFSEVCTDCDASNNTRQGFMDTKGKVIIEPKYNTIMDFGPTDPSL